MKPIGHVGQIADQCVFRSFTGAAPLKLGRLPGLGGLTRVFRSFTGAAPLKQRQRRLHLQRDPEVFRSFTGAAPLKQSATKGRSPVSAAVFRSFTGAAPLKPCRWSHWFPCKTCLPLLHRSGPIEALRIDRQGLRVGEGLPLLHRSGPIEAGLRAEKPAGRSSVFRSFTGAAPLKHRLALLVDPEPGGLPLLHRSGPIEARCSWTTPRSGRQSSAPSPERPH